LIALIAKKAESFFIVIVILDFHAFVSNLSLLAVVDTG